MHRPLTTQLPAGYRTATPQPQVRPGIGQDRAAYSAPSSYLNRNAQRKNAHPHNFIYLAPQAKEVYLMGDFNQWNPSSHPMKRQVDGAWLLQLPLAHGHHHYMFLVDGLPTQDPRAHGTARNEKNEKISLVAIS